MADQKLKNIVREVKKIILITSYKVQACHIGSALSVVDILVDLYFNRMKPKDEFIFSKASGVSALYAVLALKGIIPKDKVAYYLKNYPLASSDVPGIRFSVGSLGHGLPVSVGMAFADRSRDVYCLISDAEIQEGTTWSSLLFARHHKLENLKVICDANGWQACGRTRDIVDIDIPLYRLQQLFSIEIVYSKKGKGIDFMEANPILWHYENLDADTYKRAICQI